MFERHFGLRENPFHSGHQMRFLYPSREHQEARAHLRFGIENREPFVLITGEVGTGKTTALYDALAEWGSKVSVALVTNSALSREEMLEEICLRFGVPLPASASKPQALAQLERHLLGVRSRGEHAVLLLDEAQNLSAELLEEIRLLSNAETSGEKLMQIFLVGQPELEAKLADSRLRQLRQRITVHYRINPLSPEETAGYVHHRVSVAGGNPWQTFPAESCREIYRVTHGIPREINTLATQALITAYTEGAATVSAMHVHAAAKEGGFKSVMGGLAEMPDGDFPMPPEPAENEARTPAWQPPELEGDAPANVPHPAPAARTPTPLAEPARVSPPAAPAPEPAPAPALGRVVVAPPPAGRGSIESPPDSDRESERSAPSEIAGADRGSGAGPAVHTVRREELDAWTVAARNLMEARRRTPGGEGPQPEEPGDDGFDDDGSDSPPRFPTVGELRARGAGADPNAADLSGLPARLRQKIADDIAREERGRRSMPLVLGVIAIVAVAAGLVIAQRFQVIDLPFLRMLSPAPSAVPAHEAPGARTAAAVPPTPAVAPADTARDLADTLATAATAAPTHPSTTHRAATATRAAQPAPAPVPVMPSTSAARATNPATSASPGGAKTATPARDSTLYGVGVGSYLDKDRAAQELGRLAALARVPGAVMPYSDAGTVMFRVVLGRYPSNAAAEKAADDMMARLGVSEAKVLVVARGKTR